MPVVKVWLLPPAGEKQLEDLIFGIIDSILAIPAMGLSSRDDVTVLLPADLCTMGIGDELIVEIEKVFDKPERTQKVLQEIVDRVGGVLHDYALHNVPNCKFIELYLETFQQRRTAFRRREFGEGFGFSSKAEP